MSNNLTVQPYGINSYHNQMKELAQKEAALSNEKLGEIAINRAYDDVENSKTAKVYKAMPTLFAAGITALAALTTPGSVARKLGGGAATAGFFAAIGLARKVVDKVQEKRGAEKKPGKHPVLKTIAGIAGTIAVGVAGFLGAKKGVSVLAKTGLKDKINTKWFTKNINTAAIDSFFKKHSSLAFWSPIVGYLAGSSLLGAKLNKDIQKNAGQRLVELYAQRETASDFANDGPLTRAIARQDDALAGLEPNERGQIPEELLLK